MASTWQAHGEHVASIASSGEHMSSSDEHIASSGEHMSTAAGGKQRIAYDNHSVGSAITVCIWGIHRSNDTADDSPTLGQVFTEQYTHMY